MDHRQRPRGGSHTTGELASAGLDPGLPPPLVGRDDELSLLIEHLGAAHRDGFRVALIAGAAGLGKTRLAAELLAHHAETARCLSARCYRWGAATSFGPWAEALDRELRGRPEEEVRDLLGPWTAELAALLTVAADLIGRPSDRPERSHMLEALVGAFDRLTRDRPVVLHLDDVHLADSSSWEALRYLARRLATAPIAVVLTARQGPLADRPLPVEVLLGLEEEGRLLRHPLRPLDPTEITQLAHAVIRAHDADRSAFVTEPLVTWLMARSLGHPLFAIDLLRALLAEDADLIAPRLDRLPAGLRERVTLEVVDLDDDSRRVLQLLAVADQPLEPRTLRQLDDGGDLGAALDRLTRTRLVVEQDRGPRSTYEISHPIVQEAIYETIGGTQRRSLHRRLAETLLERAALGAAAGHLARGAEPGDPAAVDALCRAMAAAESSGLHREALAILAALVDLLPESDHRWLQVLTSMGWQPEWVLSHLAETDAPVATTAMQRIARQLEDRDDPAAEATVRFHLASFLSFGAGRLPEARAAAADAVRLFEVADQEERHLLARNEVAWLCGCDGDLAGQADEARSVLAAARRGGHLRAAVQAAATGAYALGFQGHFAAADALFAEALGLAQAQGNAYRVAWIRAQQAAVMGLQGRLADAFQAIGSALAHDTRAPDVLAYENRAHTAWLAGDLAGALQDLETAAAHRPVRGSRRRAWGAVLAARIHAERSEARRAATALTHAQLTYDGAPFLVWGWWVPWTEALLAWQDGEPAAALERHAAVADHLRGLGAAPYELLVLVELTACAADLGDRAHGEDALARLDRLADRLDGDVHRGLVGLVQALAAVATDDGEAARDAATTADRELGRAGYALHQAMALHALGWALARTDRPRAIDHLHAAAERFAATGALWRRDRVLNDLNRFGSRGRRVAAAVLGPASLTEREREVAALAVQGFTAREIGEQLFIGHRTVESHLAHCYAKLQITSRGELIREADRLGLRAPDTTP